MRLTYSGQPLMSVAMLATMVLPLGTTVFAASVHGVVSASADQIVSGLEATEHRKQKDLPTYSSIRRYVLKNNRFKREAEMMVRMDVTPQNGKHFEILSENGADGMPRRLLKRVLDGEADASRTQAKELAKLTRQNYDFQLLGSETLGGKRCYVLEIKPKLKSKYLLDGKIWVDPDDYQLVRMEGRTAASLSFWVGKPYIVYDFQKVGNYWLAARNQAVAEARFIGTIQLTIEVQGYELQPGHEEKLALEKLPRLRAMDSFNE